MTLAADVLEPLILADGTKINTATGKVIKDRPDARKFVEIPAAGEAQAIVAKTRRSISELPLAPAHMNVVSLVLMYTMWGLHDIDIAITIGITNDQVKTIKKLEQYSKMSNEIKEAILDHDASDIRTYFQQSARTAAEKIVMLVDEEGALGFAAAKDILDRSGHRPNDVVEHKHSFADALRIEYIERDDNQNLPTIETSYKDITPDGNRT